MDMALAQLELVFLSGIIWANLDATYGTGPKVDKAALALNSFLFGITTYVAAYLLYTLCSKEFTTTVLDGKASIPLFQFIDEIAVSIPCSFVLAVGWLYSVRYRWVMRFLNRINAR